MVHLNYIISKNVFSNLKGETRRQNGTQNIRASLQEKAKGNWLAGMAQVMEDPSSNQAKKSSIREFQQMKSLGCMKVIMKDNGSKLLQSQVLKRNRTNEVKAEK